MRYIFLFVLLSFAAINYCTAQKEIIYSFNSAVIDTLQKGIKFYKMHNSGRQVNLYVTLVTNDTGFEIYLQEYSYLLAGGLLELIKTSNRKLQIDSITNIPILVPSDRFSKKLKKDKIAEIPLTGYYIRIFCEGDKQEVIQTSMLY